MGWATSPASGLWKTHRAPPGWLLGADLCRPGSVHQQCPSGVLGGRAGPLHHSLAVSTPKKPRRLLLFLKAGSDGCLGRAPWQDRKPARSGSRGCVPLSGKPVGTDGETWLMTGGLSGHFSQLFVMQKLKKRERERERDWEKETEVAATEANMSQGFPQC